MKGRDENTERLIVGVVRQGTKRISEGGKLAKGVKGTE